MSKQNFAPKGTQDIFPEETYIWQYIEETAKEIASIYGYDEIRIPMFEHTEVFSASVGESSDIVQKEMYTFPDKGERSMTLRPEMTAGTVRSLIERGVLNTVPLPLKLFYIGSCFRYERPQAGRYREFHQFGIECFGPFAPESDAEIILLANDFFAALGIENLTLKINSIGCADCRKPYLEKLKDFFRSHIDSLDEDSIKRLETNPLRILDTKNKATKMVADKAPKITDFLCKKCDDHFTGLQAVLDLTGLSYEVDPDLVRGLDYYTNTVFEFISSNLGAQSTVCGGGRYDLLVQERGGAQTPALGFGLGLERLILELKATDNLPENDVAPDIYIGAIGDMGKRKAMMIANLLRAKGIRAENDLMDRSVKAQMKYAGKKNAKFSLIIGETELLQNKAQLKNMDSGDEKEVSLTRIDEIADIMIEIEMENLFGSYSDD